MELKRVENVWWHQLSWRLAMAFVCLAVFAGPAGAQRLPMSTRAEMLLNSARLAYNDKNYNFAAQQFREYLKLATTRYEAAQGRYGLALALIEGPEKDYTAAAAALTSAVATSFPERPYAMYYLGLSYRAMGNQAAEKATGNADQALSQHQAADEQFTRAAAQFALAAEAFRKMGSEKAGSLTPEWLTRSRCDQAEMLIRLHRYKEAAAVTTLLLNDPAIEKSRYRDVALYHHGYAAFALKDYVLAGRSLGRLAPFNQPEIGVHVRYLLARTHDLAGEHAEAIALYEAVLSAYTAEQARLEAKTKTPAPDYVARSLYYWGMLLCETNQFQHALTKFTACIEQFPTSGALPEAQLQAGICQAHLRKWGEAIATLKGLQEHAELGDQALRWLAKVCLDASEPAPLQPPQSVGGASGVVVKPLYARAEGINLAVGSLRQAAERVNALAKKGSDPQAPARRTAILLELGDTLRFGDKFKEAAEVYAQAIETAGNGPAGEQALERYAASLQLAGQYAAADQACQRFIQTYPQSAMLAEVICRYAENAMLAAAATPADGDKAAYTEAIRRFKKVIDKYPAGPHAGMAKLGIATAHYRQNRFAEALTVLESIPEAQRTGDLAAVAYLQAECLLRTLPTQADDALSAARLLDQLTQACMMFDSYAIAMQSSPKCVDAAIKVGYCRQRIAGLVADLVEQRKMLQMARRTYMETIAAYPDHPLAPVAIFEAARCTAQMGIIPQAAAQFNRFRSEPLKNSPLAPLALVHLGDCQRMVGQSESAITILRNARTEYEAALLKDPARADYVPMLRFALAMALKESGKTAEAQELFEAITRDFPKRPEAAESIWRHSQCTKDDALRQLQNARRAFNGANSGEQMTAAAVAYDQAMTTVRNTATTLTSRATALAAKTPGSDVAMRMHYDAAWCWRSLIDDDIEAARRKLRAEALKQLQDRLEKANPGQKITAKAPEIPLSAVPPQPSEQQARASYKTVISGASPALSNDARMELSEVFLMRDDPEQAKLMLQEMADNDAQPILVEKARLRLGSCYLARNDPKAAYAQFEAILKSSTTPYAFYAREGAAESLFLQQDWKGAIEQLVPFLEQPNRKVMPGVRDRAVLRLGQAYAQLGQWESSRNTLEAFAARFPYSVLVHEARYSMGWACQNLAKLDDAVAAYAEVASRTGAEVAAKAQYQTGICRLEQKRPEEALNAFLQVIYTYDYPEWTAASLCGAAQALVELKRGAEAPDYLKRVINDYPDTSWAQFARKRLANTK